MEEIMPNVRPSWADKSSIWIDNLKTDRHYDALDWVADPDDGECILTLTRTQAEHLYDRLSELLGL